MDYFDQNSLDQDYLDQNNPYTDMLKIWTRYTTPQLGSYQRVADLKKTWSVMMILNDGDDHKELQCSSLLIPM